MAELRDLVLRRAPGLLRLPRRRQGRPRRRAGRAHLRRVSPHDARHAGHRRPGSGRSSCQRRTPWHGAGRVQSADASRAAAGHRPVRLARRSAASCPCASTGALCTWATSRASARGYVDPPVSSCAIGGRPAIGAGRLDEPRTATCCGSGEDLRPHHGAASRPSCRLGIEFAQVSDQPAVVKTAVKGSCTSLLEAVADRARRQLPVPGPARRACRRADDPAGARGDLPADAAVRHRPAPHLHRRADHRAGPAGGRRDDRGRDDGAEARGRLRPLRAATFAYSATAFPMLTGTLSPRPASCRSQRPTRPPANTPSRSSRWCRWRCWSPGSRRWLSRH